MDDTKQSNEEQQKNEPKKPVGEHWLRLRRALWLRTR
jgi:hypothetical protein